MGFLSRLFGRVQEEPLAPPEPPEPEQPPEPEPEPEPEPVGAGLAPPAELQTESEPESEPEHELVAAVLAPPVYLQEAREPGPEREPELEPEPGPPAELALTLDEAVAALRQAGSDGIRIGFLSREYLRAGDDERPGARRRLVAVLTEQLQVRGLLAQGGRFELR
jgi:hypothetical protein